MSTATNPPAKKFKAKRFRVAVEGATTDGRILQRSWLEQMAKNYDPKTYGARVNLEHLRGVYPDSVFRSYGDVVSLDAAEITEGALKGKLALYATIEPLPDLVAMTTKAKQKVYTSIEVNQKFADTGEAYLMGVAVTDNPASLGTEMLEFSAKAGANSPLAARKSGPECLFTAAELLEDLAFEEETPADDTAAKFGATIKGLIARFSGRAQTDDARFAEVTEALEAAAGQFSHQSSQIAQAQAAATKAQADLAALDKRFTELQAAHTALVEKLGNTDSGATRPPATGGKGDKVTDC